MAGPGDELSRRVALVHDFFVQDGGAERCAIEIAGLLPNAPIYTTFFDGSFADRLSADRVRAWSLQRVLRGGRFRALLPLYPVYFSTLDLRAAELVVSSSVAFAKGVRTSARCLHISYVYNTMRYAWDLDGYLEGSSYSLPTRAAAAALRRPLKHWDRRTGSKPDVLVAISETVRRRIRRRWGRDAEVLHPPVPVDEFRVTKADDGFLLIAARLLAYRRLDLAVRAATALKRDLVVVGDGPERSRLTALAGPTVRFLGTVPRPQLIDLFQRCHAYVLPGIEDFGIAPVEAMAAGKPVVARALGGALETVVAGKTGVLFEEPSVSCLEEALERLDRTTWDADEVRRHADRFDRRHFLKGWRRLFRRMGVAPELYAGASPVGGNS